MLMSVCVTTNVTDIVAISVTDIVIINVTDIVTTIVIDIVTINVTNRFKVKIIPGMQRRGKGMLIILL